MNGSAPHELVVSAQANAHAVRVTPEPKSSAADSNDMKPSTEHRLHISARANAHAVRVTPEPKQAAMRGRTV
jgi:hypothetical protein